jgi:uncharacterized protein YqeY
MASLLDRLQADLNSARKAQDKPRTLLLGTILADIKNRRIELRRDPDDAEVTEVLARGIKRRRESIEMFDKGGRAELAEKERLEVVFLEAYLPAQATDEEIRDAVRKAIGAGASQMGAVMSAVMPTLKGRAEGSRINSIVREELASRG